MKGGKTLDMGRPLRKQFSAPDDAKKSGPPMMQRSRAQIATSYAPGVLMTWEGGRGICRSVPIKKAFPERLPRNVTDTIFEGITQFAQNWRVRAAEACPAAPDEFILDDAFVDSESGEIRVDQTRFVLNQPNVVGYVPYPLLFQCGECGRVHEFKSVAELAKKKLPARCKDHTSRWTQVDVVYAHWYGTVEPLSPYNWTVSDDGSETRQIERCTCGWQQFILKNKAPVFSEWRYVCEGCGTQRDLKKAERDVLQKLKKDSLKPGGQPFEYIQVDMLPVSYRASSAFYPQRGSFIEVRETKVVQLMKHDKQDELLQKLAVIHSIPYEEPSDAEIEQALRQAGRHGEWIGYQSALSFMATFAPDSPMRRAVEDGARSTREKWFTDGIAERGRLASDEIAIAAETRKGWAQKFDPIRLTVEHAAFVEEHIVEGQNGPRKTAISVAQPDITLYEKAGVAEELIRYQAEVKSVLKATGIGEMYILRSLPICEYSFGFTRVSATPVYERVTNNRTVPMPVRLVAFDTMKSGERPIYVTQQKNEALYIKLDEARVLKWLEVNAVVGLPTQGESLARRYLETYQDFGQFLDRFKDKERQGMSRELAPYVYMLLHSLSHQLIHSLADASGLDRDGIGEYIFPADLAFTIYRKGMTADLGNISAMWRNHAMDFLRRSIDPRMLRCGSGSLCDSRGGACPACIMVSEVSCNAGNLLLSRSVLKGGPAPQWEAPESAEIIGYFDPMLNS
ncbi:hypothetical protein [Neorhizobium petrolearium]|uniref:DUF1998 domain-containing protein n=1 Tax=Neorhizobium petrolearium TaxID=515361 RepID=A0ABY8M8U4_9HYPH|nr:hypothetical protein [Neorhizobium petrolearium]MCC2610851.1 hypothetical protein [Neorhizobium petrolearium]WGI70966.1 hypothetical protein QEO92_13445 [Neorhizobium petrolearium]